MSRQVRLLLIGLGMMVVIGLTALGLASWYHLNLRAVGDNKQARIIRIEQGESAAEIAHALHEQKVIKSALAFRVYLQIHRLSGEIQAGVYKFPAHLNIPTIAERIVTGQTATRSVTVISGWRIDQVRAALIKVGYPEAEVDKALSGTYSYSILANKPPEANLEGYLYPDTYIGDITNTATDIVNLMLANMDKKVTEDIRSAWAGRGLNLHQAITLASIVQKEVAQFPDQVKVAQVFLKRLSVDMPLEADPTFQYPALLMGVTPSITLESPYNTYRVKGLPPGPISSVEASALKAVAHPATTDFLFFVSAPDGTTYFSHTDAEHQANVAKYLR